MDKERHINNRLVEIARFQYPADASTLITLLESEGIESVMRNGLTSQIFGNIGMGEAIVEVWENDANRAYEIMKEGGYLSFIPNKKIRSDSSIKEERSISSVNPYFRYFIILLLILIALNLIAGIFITLYYFFG